MSRWITLPTLGLLLVLGQSALAAPDKVELYHVKTGTYTCKTVDDIQLEDKARNKKLGLRVSYPVGGEDAAEKFPLIIFSHGAMGSADGADPLVDHWVSFGYIVIRPTHGDSLSLLPPDERRKALLRIRKHVNSSAVTGQWDDRPADVKLILNSLDTIESIVPAIKGRIDRDRLAHAGHSFGAHTAMLLAGLEMKNPLKRSERVQFDEKRFRCFVMISPQGTGPSTDARSYSKITRPSLFITGDNDGSPIRGQEDKAGEWRREAYDHAGPGDKYLLWVKDAHHDFGGINGRARYPGAGAPNADMVNYVKTTALAMFDAYLKEDATAKAYLTGKKLAEITDGKARLESR